MAGIKLSNLAAIPFSQLDDEDILYIVDVSNGTETYVSNRISLGDLRRAIISGATAGIVAKPIIYELTDNAGTPVLPQGVTYASLLEDLTEKQAIVELNYLDKIYQVSLISNLRIEFSNIDQDTITIIRITSANVVSLESFDNKAISDAVTGATNGVKLADGVLQFDNDTVDSATPAEITGGTANKVIQADDLDVALRFSTNIVDITKLAPIDMFGSWSTDADGVTTVYGEAAYAASCGVKLASEQMSKFKSNRRYLVTLDVFVPSDSAITKMVIHSNGVWTWYAVSPYTQNTTTKGTWTTLAITAMWTGDIGSYLAILGNVPTAGAIEDFKFRRFRIMDVTDIPSSAYLSLVDDGPAYLYEPSDGILINGKEILVDEATPANTMNGVSNKTVTPNSLKSAFSVGQCVDCTAVPQTNMTFVDPSGESGTIADLYRGTFGLTSTATTSTKSLGFYSGNYYPKAANTADGTPLKYLFLCDVTNNGSTTLIISATVSTSGSSTAAAIMLGANSVASNSTVRVAFTFNAGMVNGNSHTVAQLKFTSATSAAYDVTISNLREFEVMALTDDAIKYLAGVVNPDNADAQYFIKTDMVSPWTNIINMGNAPAVTIASGLAYKSTIATGSTCTFSTDTCPTGTYGRDAHLVLFVGLDSTAIFQPPLSLMNPLTPGAGHNITIKYRDGQALAYVDDTDIGYVVSVTAGTENGSLYYGLVNSSDEYIVFSETTDGTPIEVIGATFTNKKFNMLGNGVENTIITGGTVVIKNTAAKPEMIIQNVTLDNLTFYLGEDTLSLNLNLTNVKITNLPANMTSYGALLYITTNGSLLNCEITGNTQTAEGTGYPNYSLVTAGRASGCTFHNNKIRNNIIGGGTVSNCIFRDNSSARNNGADIAYSNTYNCLIDGSTFYKGTSDFDNFYSLYNANSVGTIQGSLFTDGCDICIFSDGTRFAATVLTATNTFFGKIVKTGSNNNRVNLVITQDAVIDISGNTNTVFATADMLFVGTITRQSSTEYTINVSGTASVIPYGETEPVAITGSGNTLLNTGKLGYLVSVASGTAANTLYDALVGGGTAYSNVIFDPALDGQTVSFGISGSTVASRNATVYGNGMDVTILSASGLTSTGSTVTCYKDLTISGATVQNMRVAFENCKLTGIKNITTTGYPFYSQAFQSNPALKNCIITGNTITNNTLTWVMADVVGTTISNNNCRTIFNCSYPNRTMTFDSCVFVDNTASANNFFIGINDSVNSSSAGTFKIKDCYFNNPDNTSSDSVSVAYDTTYGYIGSQLIISGSTFSSVNDGIKVGHIAEAANSLLTFEGANIVNSTIHGYGTVVFADGATVTSTIPSGSTIGTGVISIAPDSLMANMVNKHVVLENLTITGVTSDGPVLCCSTNSKLEVRNCIITGNTVTTATTGHGQAYCVYGENATSVGVFENVTISGNVGAGNPNDLYYMLGTAYVKNCTVSNFIVWGALYVFSGENTGHIRPSINSSYAARIVFEPGTIHHNTSSSAITMMPAGMIYVGTYDEVTDTVDITGTATIYLGDSTPITISGSGTTIDSTGLHS